MTSKSLGRLLELGQSCWLDDLSREMLTSGELATFIREYSVRGVTSNPATFGKAIGSSNAYDDLLRAGARAGQSAPEIYERLTTRDVQGACDLLLPVYDETAGTDGFVSLEVSPHLARNAAASIAEAERLAGVVDRPNLMLKIPGTVEGLTAIEELLWSGINVNVTLLFSVDRYKAVLEAYRNALERRLAANRSIDRVTSVASFFLSRIDVLVDELLEHRKLVNGESSFEPHPEVLRGRAAIANARVAHALLRRELRSERWQALERAGARPQRLLWASTGTKNPAYSDVMYIESLVGPQTVTTMPVTTLEAFADHGTARKSLGQKVTAARQTLRDLRQVGIEIANVAWQLENEGIQKFIKPFDRSLAEIETKRARFAVQDDLADLEGRALECAATRSG